MQPELDGTLQTPAHAVPTRSNYSFCVCLHSFRSNLNGISETGVLDFQALSAACGKCLQGFLFNYVHSSHCEKPDDTVKIVMKMSVLHRVIVIDPLPADI